MSNSFFAYLQQLELLAFFSGYPLVYAGIIFIAGNQPLKNNFKNRLVSLLPFSYAFVGTLYFGFQLNKFYPDYSVQNINQTIQHPWLTAWALFSMLFWIPAFGNKKVLSLIHSVVFFYFLLKDIFLQLSASPAERYLIRNDMTIYTESLCLNLGAFALIVLLTFLSARIKKHSNA
jgi:hypothetical protein